MRSVGFSVFVVVSCLMGFFCNLSARPFVGAVLAASPFQIGVKMFQGANHEQEIVIGESGHVEILSR